MQTIGVTFRALPYTAGRASVVGAPLVAILGTRYPDFAIEEEALAPHGATIVSDPGGSPEAILAAAGGGRRRPRRLGAQVHRRRAGRAPLPRHRALRHRHRLHRPRRGPRSTASRWPGCPTTAPRRWRSTRWRWPAPCSAACPTADRAIRAGGWGFAGPTAAAPAEHTDRRRGRVRADRTPGGRVLPRPGLHGRARTTSTSTCPPTPASGGVDLDSLLETSDVVSLHAPGDPSAPDRCSMPTALARMKPGSVLVNTARGSLVDIAGACRGARRRPAGAAPPSTSSPPSRSTPSVFAGVDDRVLLTPAHGLVHRRVRGGHAPQGGGRGGPTAARRAAARPRRRAPTPDAHGRPA